MPQKAQYMVKSFAAEEKVSIQKRDQTNAARYLKRPRRWLMMIEKRQHRSSLDTQPRTRKGCVIVSSNLTKGRAALSCMFLMSGRSQTNAVIQMYISDVVVKQGVNALMSCAAFFQLQHLILTESLHACGGQKATISA